eukprot:TRINITY_DN21905_c0_g1_i1.p2 TRINITY_DN21905_c0_g1~~TRINITY_DN21905_c0_g1_i1.p2  ORF type:complete len:265 (-),score=73.23 TRINITY_DN21905_c0_g1_i1:98-892(-)
MAALWKSLLDLIDDAQEGGYDFNIRKGNYGVVVFGHTIFTLCQDRENAEKQDKGATRGADALYDACASYFLNGYGGSMMADIVVGRPCSAFTNGVMVKSWLFFHWLLRASPVADLVCRIVQTPRHPVRLALLSLDCIDDATTLVEKVEASAALFPNNKHCAPIVLGTVCMSFGRVLRHLYTGTLKMGPMRLLGDADVRNGIFLSILTMVLRRIGFSFRNTKILVTAMVWARGLSAELGRPLPDPSDALEDAAWFSRPVPCQAGL